MFLRFQTLPINVKQGPHCEKFPQNGVFDDFFTNWWKMPERATEASLVAALYTYYTTRLPSISMYYILSIQSDRSEASSSPWLLLSMHNTEIVSVSCNYSEIITNSHICNDICNSTHSKWNFFC